MAFFKSENNSIQESKILQSNNEENISQNTFKKENNIK